MIGDSKFYGEDQMTGVTETEMADGIKHVFHEIDLEASLVCKCGAVCKDTPTERGRFLRRHPSKCSERREFTKRLAAGTRHLDDLETNR